MAHGDLFLQLFRLRPFEPDLGGVFDHRREGGQNHVHASALLFGIGFDSGQFSHILYNPLQQLSTEFRMGHFTTAEHDKNLNLVAIFKELANVLGFKFVVVGFDFGTETHLLDFCGVLFLARIFLFFGRFILVAAIIHDAAYRRFAVARHLHQIKVGFFGAVKRFFDRNYSCLFTLGVNEPDRTNPNAVIDAGLSWSRYTQSPSASVNFAGRPRFLMNLHCQALGFNLLEKFFDQIRAADRAQISITPMAQRDLVGFGFLAANHQHVRDLGQFGFSDFMPDFL